MFFKKDRKSKKSKNDNLPKLPSDIILRLSNINKKFGDFQALTDISFDLKKGERVGLIGANGAGKTTISEIIIGLNKPTSGNIQYGFKYKNVPQEKIGMQFQDSTFPSGLTVKDIITFARNVHKNNMSNKELKNLLTIFQMDDFYNRTSRSLSGGQRQKINILLSVLHKPELVILDELSTGLDIAAREDIISFADKLLEHNNISAIVISHHMAEIKALCDHVIILDRGKIHMKSSIADLEKKYGSLEKYMKTLITDSNNDKKTMNLSLKDLGSEKKIEKRKSRLIKKGGK